VEEITEGILPLGWVGRLGGGEDRGGGGGGSSEGRGGGVVGVGVESS
jgi:hypothetical protein